MTLRLSIGSLFLGAMLLSGCAPDATVLLENTSVTQASYPETTEGLRQLVEDILLAFKAEDARRVREMMGSLTIPRNDVWFMEVFGPTRGAVLNLEYRHQMAWQYGRLYKYLPPYALSQNHLVHVELRDRRNLEPFSQELSLFSAAQRPLRSYFVAISPQSGVSLSVGTFVYVDGTFRFLGPLDVSRPGSFFRQYQRPFEY